MSKYAVNFTRRANAQLRNIFTYISEDNPEAALKMVDKLEIQARRLEDMPFVGTELSKEDFPFLPFGYRRLIVNPFIVYYRVINQIVYITHILHSKQNQAAALKASK
jgi:toxin ParE1/3/4